MHEYQEIVDGLLDGIEQLYLVAFSQRTVLDAILGDAWKSPAALAQAEFAPIVAELFAPLRDAIAGAPDGSYPAGDWRQVVQRLVDSATPPEL